MILANGRLYPSEQQNELLSSLEQKLNRTLENGSLSAEAVIAAFDRLSRRIVDGEFDLLISSLGAEGAERYAELAAKLLSRENIEHKIRTELPELPESTSPPHGLKAVKIRREPLGVLFHIAAGNAEVLPAFSVAEGLLTGNVNILKLPQADRGLTIEIFLRLLEEEPSLTDYIYVFDTPSADIAAMRKMADMADGIAVWGGNEAISAVRRLAPDGVRIIEWGHKLGFCYISGYTDKDAELAALAEHIMSTKQLLCSSCQVIYLDTDSFEDIRSFCDEFLPYLERAAEKFPVTEIGAAAEITLRRYTDSLERDIYGSSEAERLLLQGDKTSLTACRDSGLELSYMYGNVLVKPLPRQALLTELRNSKGALQTAGLICSPEKRSALTELLIRCGATRVTAAGGMSESFSGEAHDGDYALQRYTRIVNIE